MKKTQPAALITGSSSGIGETFARKLSQRGYRLILVARREERLKKLAQELGNAESLPADLTVDADRNKVAALIADEPEMEFLVNNAGFGVPGRFHETDLEEQDRLHRLHILAVQCLTHAALKGMVARRKGNIINVSSVAAFFTAPHNVTYAASKSWINAFTEGIYLELKGTRSPVRVQALCPGFTHSEFHEVIRMDRSLVPKWLWMSSVEVVEESLKALERNRLIVIPGRKYRMLVRILSSLPKPIKHLMAVRHGKSRLELSKKKTV